MQAIADRCPTRGLVIANAATLPKTLDLLDVSAIHMRDVEGYPCEIGDGHVARGWIRRLAPDDWDAHTVMGSQLAAVLAARLTLLGAVARDPSVAWLTEVDDLFAAENKVVQLRAAAAQGLRIPETVVSTGLSGLADLGASFVVKPLGPGHYLDPDGRVNVVHATVTSAERLAGVDLSEAPFLAQRRIAARQHVRVVTVNGHAWPCSMRAAGLPLDWRLDPEAHDGFRHDPSLASLATSALALAEMLRCGYSSQDWLIDDDGPLFLDFNPGGQWLFLPADVADEISEALASWIRGSA